MYLQEIIFTGPECSGKTTLAREVAKKYNEPWVPEFARTYLEHINRDYVETDILEIAKGQLHSKKQIATSAKKFLFQDTSWLVLKVWSEHKYGHCDPWIDSLLINDNEAFYFLCKPDLPWTEESLRESQHERWILYERYFYWLSTWSKPFQELKGPLEDRLIVVDAALKKLLPEG